MRVSQAGGEHLARPRGRNEPGLLKAREVASAAGSCWARVRCAMRCGWKCCHQTGLRRLRSFPSALGSSWRPLRCRTTWCGVHCEERGRWIQCIQCTKDFAVYQEEMTGNGGIWNLKRRGSRQNLELESVGFVDGQEAEREESFPSPPPGSQT